MDIETDPKDFGLTKKLQGNDNKTSATYIRDHNGYMTTVTRKQFSEITGGKYLTYQT